DPHRLGRRSGHAGGALRAVPDRGQPLPAWGRAGAAHHAPDRQNARESHPHADVRGAAARLAPHPRALRARRAAASGHGPARSVAVRTVRAMGMIRRGWSEWPGWWVTRDAVPPLLDRGN